MSSAFLFRFLLNLKFLYQLKTVIPDDINNLNGSFTARSDGVLSLWRNYSIHFMVNKSFFFQFAQLGGEHFMCDVGDIFFEFIIADDPAA